MRELEGRYVLVLIQLKFGWGSIIDWFVFNLGVGFQLSAVVRLGADSSKSSSEYCTK